MKIWYDTEFLEDGKTIELISIGMVREDGKEYYAVVDVDAITWLRITKHDWLIRNVLPSLPLRNVNILDTYISVPENSYPKPSIDLLSLDFNDAIVKPKRVIANEVRDFITEIDKPSLWAWYGAYDHVALCQLWGPMIAIHGTKIPFWTNDLKQECNRLGNPIVPQQENGQHNALEDARHNREIDKFLNLYKNVKQNPEIITKW